MRRRVLGAVACWLVATATAADAGAQDALRAPRNEGARVALAARADSLHALALQLNSGDAANQRAAVAVLREEIGLQQRLNRTRELGAAWNVLGHAYLALAQHDSALVAYQRALVARRSAGDTFGIGASTSNLGNVHLAAGRLDSAIVHYRRAIVHDRATGERELEAMSLRNLAQVHVDSALRVPAQRDSALRVLHEAMDVHRALGAAANEGDVTRTLEDIGDAHDAAGRADSAIAYWHGAIASIRRGGDETREGDLLFGIGALHEAAARVDSAQLYFTRSVTLAESDGDASMHATALHRLGMLHQQRGEDDLAMARFREALVPARRSEDARLAGAVLRAMATLSRQSGQLDSAARYFEESLGAYRAARDRDGEATALVEQARYFRSAGRRDSAVTQLNAALGLWREVDDTAGQVFALLELTRALQPLVPSESRVLNDSIRRVFGEAMRATGAAGNAGLCADLASDLAAFYLRLRGQSDSARVHATAALALYRGTGNAVGEATVLGQIALTHTQPDSVAFHADRGIAVARAAGAPSTEWAIQSNTGAHYLTLRFRDTTQRELVARALSHLHQSLRLTRTLRDAIDEASALADLGDAYKLVRPVQWATAAAYYDSSWVALERVRRNAGDEATRIAFAEQHANTARQLVDAWSNRARQTAAQADRRRAFAAHERARARALVDLLGQERAPAFLAGALAASGDTLIARLTRPGVAYLAYLVGEDTTAITMLLPSGRLAHYDVQVSQDRVDELVADLRRALQVDSAAVRAIPAMLEALDDRGASRGLGLQGGVADAGASLDSALARVAGHLLPAALRARLERERIGELVIVTDGRIASVPFAALPYDAKRTPLGLRMALRFTPSLTVLAEAESRPVPPRSAGAVVVVGNPTMPSVADVTGTLVQLTALPGAAAEAHSIAATLGTESITGAQATEQAVRDAMPSAAVVHLATHGYAYATEGRSRDSFIALAPDATHDGLLTVGEVLDMDARLRADLVVLSACQTALGRQTNAEGTVGLQRAFLAKGARSLLVSLWSVDDAVTRQLMERFYAHWTTGANKGEALRRAQGEVRATHPDPRYWAAFQLVGAN